MKKKSQKQPYQKPKIIYEKKIEVLAVVCNSGRVGPGINCRATPATCDVLYT